MKKRIISFFILAVCFIFFSQSLYAQDKVVAIVNNEVITQKDLNDFLNFIHMQYARELKGRELEEKVESLQKDLLQRLIEDRILLQQAKEEKISIDPARVKAKIDEIKKRYASESEFEQDLAKEGLVQADLENKIHEQLLMYYIVEQKVHSKVVVRPDEITSFYKQNQRQFLKPEERDLTVVILQDEDLAKAVSYELRRGTKLDDLVGKYSFSTDKLSAFQGQNLRGEIEDIVFKLGMGEISNPIKIDEKYYVFRLDDIVGSQQLSLTEAQDKIQVYLFDKKLKEALAKWLDELKKQSYIKILDN
jgi:peptidyl-prolyl cis-trans isomerase SurA